MMVCGLFSVFWLSFGFILLPTLDLAASYSTTGSAAEGAATAAYNAAIALYLIVWGFALLTFFVFTLRTNAIFAGIFFFVTLGAFILSGAYWRVSTGDYGQAMQLQKVMCSGSCSTTLTDEATRLEERCYSLLVCWAGIVSSPASLSWSRDRRVWGSPLRCVD